MLCLVLSGIFWISYFLCGLFTVLCLVAFAVAIIALVVGFILDLTPPTAVAAPVAYIIAAVAAGVALAAGFLAAILLTIALVVRDIAMNRLGCPDPLTSGQGFQAGFAPGFFMPPPTQFPFPLPFPFPFPPPSLPGFDWNKFLKCLLGAMPCGCSGGRGPGWRPKDPKEFFEDAWGRFRQAKEILENGRREAEERANEFRAWVERAGDAATEEMRNKLKQAEEEAKKLKDKTDSAAATGGEILSEIWPPPQPPSGPFPPHP